MFLIFKIFPDWLFYAIVLCGIIGFFASYWKPLRLYDEIFKSIGILVTVGGIYLLGMLYADNTWKQAALALQTKANVIAVESKAVNNTLNKELSNLKQQNKEKIIGISEYIDREVKTTCELPQEVLNAHNKAIK